MEHEEIDNVDDLACIKLNEGVGEILDKQFKVDMWA
jgi:hypothetical protein